MSTPLEQYRPWEYIREDAPVAIPEGGGYVDFLTVARTGLPDGTYKLNVQVTWSSDSTNTSTDFQATVNGVTTQGVSKELKDTDDIESFTAFLITTITGGTLDIVLRASRTTGSGTQSTIIISELDYERKLEA